MTEYDHCEFLGKYLLNSHLAWNITIPKSQGILLTVKCIVCA